MDARAIQPVIRQGRLAKRPSRRREQSSKDYRKNTGRIEEQSRPHGYQDATSPRYTHLAVQVSATTTSVRSGSFGFSLFQIQAAMFSLVGILQTGNLVQVEVVEPFPSRLEGARDIRVVHHPA